MAAKANVASPFNNARTAAGGQAVVVTLASKERFYISIINGGTVRATPATRGRVHLVVDGSTVDSLLEISPIVDRVTVQSSGSSSGSGTTQVLDAHTFRTALRNQSRLINIASIRVTSGTIGAIEGYRDSILSGPVTINSTNRVDRIAFGAIVKRGSISVGGDLNTLDVLTDATFDTSSGLSVGRDLNSFSVGGNLVFQNGANGVIGRDIGLTPQAAKGSGPAGQGILVQGNITVAPTSTFSIGRAIDGNAAVIANGNLSGLSRITIQGFPIGNTPFANQIGARGSVS